MKNKMFSTLDQEFLDALDAGDIDKARHHCSQFPDVLRMQQRNTDIPNLPIESLVHAWVEQQSKDGPPIHESAVHAALGTGSYHRRMERLAAVMAVNPDINELTNHPRNRHFFQNWKKITLQPGESWEEYQQRHTLTSSERDFLEKTRYNFYYGEGEVAFSRARAHVQKNQLDPERARQVLMLDYPDMSPGVLREMTEPDPAQAARDASGYRPQHNRIGLAVVGLTLAAGLVAHQHFDQERAVQAQPEAPGYSHLLGTLDRLNAEDAAYEKAASVQAPSESGWFTTREELKEAMGDRFVDSSAREGTSAQQNEPLSPIRSGSELLHATGEQPSNWVTSREELERQAGLSVSENPETREIREQIRQAFQNTYSKVHSMVTVPEGFQEQAVQDWLKGMQRDMEAHSPSLPRDSYDYRNRLDVPGMMLRNPLVPSGPSGSAEIPDQSWTDQAPENVRYAVKQASAWDAEHRAGRLTSDQLVANILGLDPEPERVATPAPSKDANADLDAAMSGQVARKPSSGMKGP